MKSPTPFVTDADLIDAEEQEYQVVVADSEAAKRRILSAPASQQMATFLRYAPNLTHDDIESLVLDLLGRRDTKIYKGGILDFVDPYLPVIACAGFGLVYAFLHLDQIWMVSCLVWLGYCAAYILTNQPLALELRVLLAIQVAWVVPMVPTFDMDSLRHIMAFRFDPAVIAITNTIAMAFITLYLTKHVYRRH